MYFPPLFPSVRPFDPRSNPLGGDTPAVTGRAENPLDLSVKALRQDSGPDGGEELLMLDHRKLASLAASHSLSAMGRQFAPGLLDPALFRLSYGQEALVPPPFCYDRATGVAVPNSLAGHQLMSNFLQQRDRCLEQQQQALLAARTSAAQQAAVAAAFMDPALSFNLRGAALSQREALAASRGLYHPALPSPMVLPAFSLYTDDKGAFTSLRGATEKAYLNGTAGALEAARFADHFQRLREQQLQAAAGKCCGTPAAALTAGLGHTVPCACCVQSPSQAALCARSPLGCVKDPTTAATAKVCNATACDYLQSGLTFLHRPTSATAAPSDLRMPVPSFVTATSFSGTSEAAFQPTSTWSTTVPTVSTPGKTAFSVPKKKEIATIKEQTQQSPCFVPQQKDSKFLNGSTRDMETGNHHNPTTQDRLCVPSISIKKEPVKREDRDVAIAEPYHQRKEHNVKSLLTPKASPIVVPSQVKSHHHHHHHIGTVAQTTVTASTPIVPTKCEGGTIPKTKLPPVLEPYAPLDFHHHQQHQHQMAERLVVDPASSPQGPPPLISVTNGSSTHQDKKPYALTTESSMLRHQALLHASNLSAYSNAAKSYVNESKKSSPKKTPIQNQTGLPSYVKEEPSSKPLLKPVPQLPSASSGHPFTSHYAPYNWLPPPQTIQTSTTTSTLTPATTNTSTVFTSTNVKKEPNDYDANANVLQSLLVRANNLQRYPVPSSYPLLDFHQQQAHHQQQLARLAGIAPESGSPTVAATTPITDTKHIKVESGVAERQESQQQPPLPKAHQQQLHQLTQTHQQQHQHQAKKRPLTAIKEEDQSHVARKRPSYPPSAAAAPVSAVDYSIQSYAYPQFSTPFVANDAKDSPKCPYTFVPEPPGYYEGQVVVPKEFRPFKSLVSCSTGGYQDDKACIQREITYPDVLNLGIKDSGVVFPTSDLQLRTAKRTLAARAMSRFRKRILSRIYYRRQRLTVAAVADKDDDPESSPADPTANPTQPNGGKQLIAHIATSLRQSRILRKIARRRRIRSGLDMALKHKKKKKTTYKLCVTQFDDYQQDQIKVHDASGIPVPSEMKKLMVNKALGETVLHRAARLGYTEVVAYCLETKCANVNVRDNAGYTPLHECCARGHLEIARALLQYGADVNASAAGGIRPLHDASENDHVEVVRLLLSFGADPSIATYSGLTPLKLARSPLMAEFLQGFIADISGEIENRPHLPWRFWGSASCLDPEENGYDVFEGAPSDDDYEVESEGNDFLFEVSDSPHLPTFRLVLPNSNKTHCNFLRLSDVLRKTFMSREYFVDNYGHIDVVTVPRHEFESNATCSQLLTGSKLDTLLSTSAYADGLENGPTVDLVRLDNHIRKVLDIETISVR